MKPRSRSCTLFARCIFFLTDNGGLPFKGTDGPPQGPPTSRASSPAAALIVKDTYNPFLEILEKNFPGRIKLLKIVKDNAARMWRNQLFKGKVIRLEDWKRKDR